MGDLEVLDVDDSADAVGCIQPGLFPKLPSIPKSNSYEAFKGTLLVTP